LSKVIGLKRDWVRKGTGGWAKGNSSPRFAKGDCPCERENPWRQRIVGEKRPRPYGRLEKKKKRSEESAPVERRNPPQKDYVWTRNGTAVTTGQIEGKKTGLEGDKLSEQIHRLVRSTGFKEKTVGSWCNALGRDRAGQKQKEGVRSKSTEGQGMQSNTNRTFIGGGAPKRI